MLKILPLSSQYIFSLVMFAVNNRDLFIENSELCNIKIRNNCNLYQPSSYLMIYQKGPYYNGIKVHNNLPAQIKMLTNIKQLKMDLINFPFILYLNNLITTELNSCQ